MKTQKIPIEVREWIGKILMYIGGGAVAGFVATALVMVWFHAIFVSYLHWPMLPPDAGIALTATILAVIGLITLWREKKIK